MLCPLPRQTETGQRKPRKQAVLYGVDIKLNCITWNLHFEVLSVATMYSINVMQTSSPMACSWLISVLMCVQFDVYPIPVKGLIVFLKAGLVCMN